MVLVGTINIIKLPAKLSFVTLTIHTLHVLEIILCTILLFINSLPNDKNGNMFKLKAFADDNSKIAQMMEIVSDRV